MNAMDLFVAATEPVLREALKGTCIKATYMLTPEGGEVRLRLDLHSVLTFSEESLAVRMLPQEQRAEQWAEEVRALVEGHKDMLGEASRGSSRFANPEPTIVLPGTMTVRR